MFNPSSAGYVCRYWSLVLFVSFYQHCPRTLQLQNIFQVQGVPQKTLQRLKNKVKSLDCFLGHPVKKHQ